MAISPVIPVPPESYVRRILGTKYNISFAGGLPDDVLLTTVIRPKVEKILAEHFDNALLNYGPTSGSKDLREKIAQIESERQGTEIVPQNILITAGSQQGIDIAVQLYASGQQLVMEMPSYLGAIPVAQQYVGTDSIITVDIDAQGIRIDMLEKILEDPSSSHIKAIYVVPNGHNPAGVRMNSPRRARLLELAQRNGLMIIEDDPYYGTGENPLKNILGLDTKMDNTLLLRTFSKELCNMRIGYVVAHEDVIAEMSKTKAYKDLHSPLFNQWLIFRLIQEMEQEFGSYSGYLNDVVARHYKPKREAMGESLTRSFGDIPDVKWNIPKEGLFYWVQFPEGTNTEELYHIASTQFGLVFVPGVAFDPRYVPSSLKGDPTDQKIYISPIRNSARLNFSCPSLAQIDEGMIQLRQAYDAMKSSN